LRHVIEPRNLAAGYLTVNRKGPHKDRQRSAIAIVSDKQGGQWQPHVIKLGGKHLPVCM
jgi:hypothetical protein